MKLAQKMRMRREVNPSDPYWDQVTFLLNMKNHTNGYPIDIKNGLIPIQYSGFSLENNELVVSDNRPVLKYNGINSIFSTIDDYTIEIFFQWIGFIPGQECFFLSTHADYVNLKITYNTTNSRGGITGVNWRGIGSSTGIFIPGNYYHLAITKNGLGGKIFLNGYLLSSGSNGGAQERHNHSVNFLSINSATTGNGLNARIQAIRWTKAARWTTDLSFTPPTLPLPQR